MSITTIGSRAIRFCSASIAIALLLLLVSNVQGAIIRLKPQASVDAGVVLLSDVADVFDRDAATATALRDVTLMPAPAEGEETRIDFTLIRTRLQAQGFNLTGLEFTGNSSVNVQGPPERPVLQTRSQPRAARPLPASSWQVKRAERLLSEAILSYLRTAQLGAVDIEVRFDTASAGAVVSGQNAGYEIRGGQPPWDTWQDVTVRFIDRDEQLQSLAVEFRAVEKPLVPVAKHALPAGHVIARGDVELQAADDAAGSFPGLNDVVGRETIASIRQGQVVRPQSVRSIPLVRRNDVVTAIAEVGSIRVKQQMVARSEGAMGDRVTLRTFDGQQLEATVVGYHEAVVVRTSPESRDQMPQDDAGGTAVQPDSEGALR